MKFAGTILIFLLLALTNCGSRYYNWFTCVFKNDGIKRNLPISNNSSCSSCDNNCNYVCSKVIYDKYRTLGFIDVLWFNAQIRKEYIELSKEKKVLNFYDFEDLAQKQEDLFDTEITFYILIGPYNEVSLSTDITDAASWSVSLQVNNNSYQPYSIKAVDLEAEIAYFFNCFTLDNKNYFRFRQPYIVKFKAKDLDRNIILNPNTCEVQLTISTVNYCTTCNWIISPDKREIIW